MQFRPREFGTAFAMLGLCLAAVSWAQEVPTKPADTETAAPPPVLTIPDGTQVELRFAQGVRASSLQLGRPEREAKPGDKVRLVVVSAIKASGFVVVAKGAIGEATVKGVWVPSRKYPDTGLSLQLDWIEDVTGSRIPLRAAKQGKAEAFTVDVLSSHGGIVARPQNVARDVAQIMSFAFVVTWLHKKPWIPPGTRILGFVHGPIDFEVTDLQRIQSQGSLTSATVTIYRKKGQGDTLLQIRCDGKEAGRIGARQYVLVELAPGKHSCQAEQRYSLEIDVSAGDEYYIQIRPHGDGWELRQVSVSEGEDDIIKSEPATQ